MSWAAIAKAPAVAPAPIIDDSETKPRIAVIDANAIINGEGLLNLIRFNDKIITTAEVLKEIRDKKSRDALAALPFTIETREPSDESIRAVTKFARATGDLHSLSIVDIRLIALARTLEASHHGTAHLKDLPPPPRQKKSNIRDEKELPGWGAQGGDWVDMDRLNEEEIAAAEAALRVGNKKEGEEEEEGGAGMSSTSRIVQAVQELRLTDDDGNAGGGDFVDIDDDDNDNDNDNEVVDKDDGEWETAMKSRNASRRQKRLAEQQEESSEEEEEEEEEDDSDGSDISSDDDQSLEESKDNNNTTTTTTTNGSTSTICSITSDFAMQNVTLQMGLRLVTLDGRLISQLSRWVLRCTACSNLTREMGRVFCPRCGNAALDKVRVTIAPDGTEQYGVKKKHILRGTKFSLPKPKGGRSKDVILREDVLMEKTRRLRRKHVRKGMDELDAFAPEMMHNDAWFQAAALPGGDKGAAALLAGWKKNPNERKHIATNRRRK